LYVEDVTGERKWVKVKDLKGGDNVISLDEPSFLQYSDEQRELFCKEVRGANEALPNL